MARSIVHQDWLAAKLIAKRELADSTDIPIPVLSQLNSYREAFAARGAGGTCGS